jgi:cytochrome b
VWEGKEGRWNVKGVITKASAASLVVSVVMLGFVSSAFADVSSDPLNGATDGVQSGLVSFIETNLVPLMVAFLVIGIAAGLLIRWSRKARTVATP